MSMLRLTLLSTASLLAMTVPSFAFTAVGSLVISALMAVPGGIAILPVVSAAVIGQAVVGTALVAANIAMSLARRTPSIDPGEYKNEFQETANQSEVRAIGRVRVGGLRVFGNTKDLNRYRLIAHTRGRWTASEEHYLGGREVTVESDGAVSSPPYARPGGSWVHIFQKTGGGNEVSWAALMADFPDLWTADHRVRGIFQSLIRYVSPGLESESAIKKFQLLYQGGEPPYEVVGRAEPIYDPRDPGQVAGSPATWQWSDNGILGATHILRSYPSIRTDMIDFGLIAVAADDADEMIASWGGNIPRARTWGFWPSEAQRGEVMEQVLRSIGAEIIMTENNQYALRMIVDRPVAEIAFDERHIVGIEWRAGPESVERPNVCRVRYYSPERNYEMADIDMTGIPWAREQTEINRVGEQYYDVELPFCPAAGQAQRIARRLFALARADVGTVTLNMAGLAAWGKSYVLIYFPDLEEEKLCAIGTPRINDDEGTVSIPFIVWPDLPPWSVSTMEARAPDPIPDMQFPSDLATPVLPLEALQVIYPGGAREIRVRFTNVSGADVAEAVSRRIIDGVAEPWGGMAEYRGSGSNWYGWRSVDWEGVPADFRVRFFDSDENSSYWSPTREARPLAVNNTACGPATVTLTEQADTTPARLTITVSETRAAYVQVSIGAVNSFPPPPITYTVDANINCRPGQSVTYDFDLMPPGNPVYYMVRVMTSNGTAGTPVEGQFTP